MIVEVDAVDSWPDEIREECERLYERAEPDPECVADLNLRFEDEQTFRELLMGHSVLAYHGTRVLPHEATLIQAHGLKTLTQENLMNRFTAARDAGHLTAQDLQALESTNVFAEERADNRKDRVCFFLSQQTMQEKPALVAPLLRSWGGEAVKMTLGARDLSPTILSLGVPSIVVAQLSLGDTRHHVWPGTQEVFVARWAGIYEDADVHYLDDVPGGDIEAIWRPGMPEYDRFVHLPRE